MNEVESIIRKYDTAQSSGSAQPSVATQKELLKKLNLTKIRRPDIVVACSPAVIRQDTSDEKLNNQEQLFFALLDQGDFTKAEACLEALMNRFPKSARVRRLIGITFEARGSYAEAAGVYDELLTENPANLQVMKRKVCIAKAKGDVKGEIEELNKILQSFPADATSWGHLGEAYLSLCEYESACHCMEELVLCEPNNANYHTRLAEAYYTVGSEESIGFARKHYVLSLDLQCAKINVRALYGAIVACKALNDLYSSTTAALTTTTTTNNSNSSNKRNIADAAVNKEILSWATAQLSAFSSGGGLFADSFRS